VSTDCIDDLCALVDQDVAGPEDHIGGLFGLALHGYEAHRPALSGFADRLSVGRIILLALHEWLHIGWCDQPHLVAELTDLAAQ
jgi:hypothetical protein